MKDNIITQPEFKQGDLLVQENRSKQKTIWLLTQDLKSATCVYSDSGVSLGTHSSTNGLLLAIFGGTVHINCSIPQKDTHPSEFSISFDPQKP